MTRQSIGQNQRCLDFWQLLPAMCTTIKWSNSLLKNPKLSVLTTMILLQWQWQWGCGDHCDNGSLAAHYRTQTSGILVWINISDDSERGPRAWAGWLMTHWWWWSDGCLMLTKYARWLVPPASHNSQFPRIPHFNCYLLWGYAGPGFNISAPSSSYSL